MSNEHKVICLSDSNAFVGDVERTDDGFLFVSYPIHFALRGNDNSDDWINIISNDITIPNWITSNIELIKTKEVDYTPDSVAPTAEVPGYGSLWSVVLKFELKPTVPTAGIASVSISGYGTCNVPAVANGDLYESPAIHKPINARASCSVRIDGLVDIKTMYVIIGEPSMQTPTSNYEIGLTEEELEDQLEADGIADIAGHINDYLSDGATAVILPDEVSQPKLKVYSRHGINKGDIVSMYNVKQWYGDADNPTYTYSKVITQVAKPVIGDTVLCTPLSYVSYDGKDIVERYVISPVMLNGRHGVLSTSGNSLISGYYGNMDYMSVGSTDLRYLDNPSRHLIGDSIATCSISVTVGNELDIDPLKFITTNCNGTVEAFEYSNLSDVDIPERITRRVAIPNTRSIYTNIDDPVVLDFPYHLNREFVIRYIYSQRAEFYEYYGDRYLEGEFIGYSISDSDRLDALHSGYNISTKHIAVPVVNHDNTITISMTGHLDCCNESRTEKTGAGSPTIIDPTGLPKVTVNDQRIKCYGNFGSASINGTLLANDTWPAEYDRITVGENMVYPGTKYTYAYDILQETFAVSPPISDTVYPDYIDPAVDLRYTVIPADTNNGDYSCGLSNLSISLCDVVTPVAVPATVTAVTRTMVSTAVDAKYDDVEPTVTTDDETTTVNELVLNTIAPLSGASKAVEDISSKVSEALDVSGVIGGGFTARSNSSAAPSNYSYNIYDEFSFIIASYQLFANPAMRNLEFRNVNYYNGGRNEWNVLSGEGSASNYEFEDWYVSSSVKINTPKYVCNVTMDKSHIKELYPANYPPSIRLRGSYVEADRIITDSSGATTTEKVSVRVFTKYINAYFRMYGCIANSSNPVVCCSASSNALITDNRGTDDWEDDRYGEYNECYYRGTVSDIAAAKNSRLSVPTDFNVPVKESEDEYLFDVDAEQYVKSVTWDIYNDVPVVELAWRGIYRKWTKTLSESRCNIVESRYGEVSFEEYDPDTDDTVRTIEKLHDTFTVVADSGLVEDKYTELDTGNVEFSDWSDDQFSSVIDLDSEFFYLSDLINKYMPPVELPISKSYFKTKAEQYIDQMTANLSDLLDEHCDHLFSIPYLDKDTVDRWNGDGKVISHSIGRYGKCFGNWSISVTDSNDNEVSDFWDTSAVPLDRKIVGSEVTLSVNNDL